MSRRLVLAIAAAFVVAACADDREQSPTSPEFAPRTSTCSYPDVKQYARNLFGSNSPEYQLAQNMSGFPAGSDAATALAFDIFAAIAAERNDGVFTDADRSNAANLTVKTIGCAKVSASAGASLSFDAFDAALKSTGGYEVRGGDTDAEAQVETADGLSAINTPLVPVLDENGEPTGTFVAQEFSDWLPVRTLFYGRPRSTFSAEASGGRAYDWSIVQPGSSLAGIGGPARVAICVEVDDNASLDVFRVQHDAWSQNTILPLSDPLLECPNPLPGVALATPVTDRLIRLLAPQPLHAAALGKTGSPTGSAGSFSPFEGVNPADVKISFFSEPRDSKKNQTFKGAKGLVQVKVTGQQNTAWQGVSVLIYGVNNNGEKVQFSNDTEETGADGIAIFDQLSTNKTGAYKLWAKTIPTSPGSVSFAQDSVLSNKFNVRP